MNVLVTGGCGFIGSHLVRCLVEREGHEVLNLDALTYAGNRESLRGLESHSSYLFKREDVCDAKAVADSVFSFQPDWIMHLAAESHVDRSISSPDICIQTNIMGTCSMLKVARDYYDSLSKARKARFRYLHVSTDEVYGSLGSEGFFTETTAYDPHSPYAASKAASDHLTRAWYATYALPVIVTNCCNNYGPFQFPEKLIPSVITRALQGEMITIYGSGQHVRDWIHVEDHVDALIAVINKGKVGETYNIGARNEWANLDLAKELCLLLDELLPREDGESYEKQIELVEDRPGHDFRYAIDPSKLYEEIGWRPSVQMNDALRDTVLWFIQNHD